MHIGLFGCDYSLAIHIGRGSVDRIEKIALMTKLTAAKRNNLPKAKFALPGERKYPVDTANRARNAKARASEMEHKGKLSASSEEKIDRAADRALRH